MKTLTKCKTFSFWPIAMNFMVLIMSSIAFYSCENNGSNDSPETYWLMDIDDGGIITTTDVSEGSSIRSTVRFLIRGNLKEKTPEGNWNIDIQMFCYKDMKDDAGSSADRISGYMSGKIGYNTLNIMVKKLLLPGIGNANEGNTYYHSDYTIKLPYFFQTPGKYDYTVIDEEGNPHNFRGTQPFLTGWPDDIRIEFSGSDQSNCNTVSVVCNMIDDGKISVSDLVLHGNLYMFGSKSEMESWINTHKQHDYLSDPLSIRFR
jgi:hypothetical protein